MPSTISILGLFTLLLAGAIGFWMAQKDQTEPTRHQTTSANKKPTPSTLPHNKPLTRSHRAKNQYDPKLLESIPPFALENERIATFQTDKEYQKFLTSLSGKNLKLLGKSDRLRAVRFGFNLITDLDDLNGAELSLNYAVTIPTPPDASAQAGATGFSNNALSWLGVTGDNSQWGKGITVAVLDTGVNNHLALKPGTVTQVNLATPGVGTEQSHGTAVASIISGDHPLTPGVAPASNILSIQITDASGSSNSLTLADGIIHAVDAGAQVINISMGSYGDSNVVRNAVAYAQANGSVIVASSGNAGIETIAYPAAYEGVIAVGAVEAKGEHLDFSNTGDQLGITAPGFAVNAAWGEEQLTQFSGTSASAPFISGAIAAAMTQQNLTAAQAATLVLENANEAGLPGTDNAYGDGILDLGRIMNHGTAGIYDAAIASQVIVPPVNNSQLPQVLVTIENRGTETLINSPLTVNSPSGSQTINISSLTPGAIHTYPLPILLPSNGSSVSVSSSIQITETDSNQTNNNRSSEFSK